MPDSPSQRFRLYGVLGSPYVAKLRALLRYRHIPFDYVPASFDWAPSFSLVLPELAHVKPRIVPVMYFPPDGSYRVDSSVIALDLEKLFAERSAVPTDPALAFLSSLLEDMGDEWLLKIAFQYRWGNEEDRNVTNRLVMGELLGGKLPLESIERAAQEFRDRQISRMPLVGCTPENGPAIDETFRRVLDGIESIRETRPFLFGTRPSLGDFGMFGALFTCRNDPSAGRFIRARSMGTMDWCYSLDEASGVKGEWLAGGEDVGDGVRQILEVAGQAYLPFLRENKVAFEAGRDNVSLRVFGSPYSQAPFRYQVKCLNELRRGYAELDGKSRERIDPLLRGTGCLEALQDD
ncbi:MAG: glutathione S-transferase family protein [Pseudomonadota bacterium]